MSLTLPRHAPNDANMFELQLQTNCRCDICKQHTAANQLPLYKRRQRETEREREQRETERGRKGDIERQRERDRERERHRERDREMETERQRQKDRDSYSYKPTAAVSHDFSLPWACVQKKAWPSLLISNRPHFFLL